MINPNELLILLFLMIFHYMNLNYIYNFWTLLELLLTFSKEDQRWKCCHKKIMIWWDQMGNYVFKNSFGDLYPICKCYLLGEKNPSHLFHYFLYMDAI
jgi:hypothetical protein